MLIIIVNININLLLMLLILQIQEKKQYYQLNTSNKWWIWNERGFRDLISHLFFLFLDSSHFYKTHKFYKININYIFILYKSFDFMKVNK